MPSTMSGRVLGLMSGTSLDGIDAAIIQTDGEEIFEFGPSLFRPYASSLRHHLSQAIATPSPDAQQWAEAQITQAHLEIIADILQKEQVDLIGFHGQTIAHQPARGMSKQIGDAARIARETGIDVVADFRSADIAAGGEGAPLAPLYHLALVQKMRVKLPVVIVNIGGIANITFIDEGEIIAFDSGPGNGLMDEWMQRYLGVPYDEDGNYAARGQVDEAALAGYLAHDFFKKPPPKSLDRHDFTIDRIAGLSVENGMATLLELTARSIALVQSYLPIQPQSWVACGGGRHNRTLLKALAHCLPTKIILAEKLGWQGDMIEAQCFAFLAVRSVRGLPLSLPTTTGCSQPTCGGVLFSAAR